MHSHDSRSKHSVRLTTAAAVAAALLVLIGLANPMSPIDMAAAAPDSSASAPATDIEETPSSAAADPAEEQEPTSSEPSGIVVGEPVDTDVSPVGVAVSYDEESEKTELTALPPEAEENADKKYSEIQTAITTQLLASSGMSQEELEALKSEIEEREAELSKLNWELDDVKDQLRTRENEIKGLEALIKYSDAHVMSLKIKKDIIDGNISALEQILGYYASEEYKFREHSASQMYELVFGSNTLQEIINALDYWDSIEQNIADNMSRLNREKSKVDEVEEQIAINSEILDQSKKDLEIATINLNQTKERYAEQMAEAQSDLLLLRGQAVLQQQDYLRQIYGSDIIAVGDMTENEARMRAAIVKTALSCLGADYVWGGESWEEGGFDCSGLCQYSYAQNGIPIMRVAVDQYNSNPKISMADLRPGDLVFFGSNSSNIYHVAMYIGDGLTIEAPQAGDVVKIRPLEGRSGIYGYASPLAAYYFGI